MHIKNACPDNFSYNSSAIRFIFGRSVYLEL